MDFKNFKNLVQQRLNEDRIWLTSKVNGYELAELYVQSLEPHDTFFRKRMVHDCSCCKNFIRDIGRLVYFEGNELKSIFTGLETGEAYDYALRNMEKAALEAGVETFFVPIQQKYGQDFNYEGDLRFEHLFFEFPKAKVNAFKPYEKLETLQLLIRAKAELSAETLGTVLELINNGLERGPEFRVPVTEFKKFLEKEMTAEEMYKTAFTTRREFAGFRNSVIGTLAQDIESGMELETAVFRFENKMDPRKFKKPRAVITEKTKELAVTTIKELGLEESLTRRAAKLDDLNINDVLFVNRDVKQQTNKTELDALLQKVVSKPKAANVIKSFDSLVEQIGKAKTVELFTEKRLFDYLVSLHTGSNESAKPLFAWDNPFSWTYQGNTADSFREQVKEAGGEVEGELRCSLKWSEPEAYDHCDLDLHCIDASGTEIYYSTSYRKDRGGRFSPTGGQLDLDKITPTRGEAALENIYWHKMPKDGIYKFFVVVFSGINNYGFKSQIEAFGEVYDFEVTGPAKGTIPIAEVIIKDGIPKVISKLPSKQGVGKTVTKWNLESNQWIPITTICKSPNFWGDKKVGNEHIFFFNQDCVPETSLSGFHNEFLRPELTTHKRFFAALGNLMEIQPEAGALSGFGFSRTKKVSFFLKIDGIIHEVSF